MMDAATTAAAAVIRAAWGMGVGAATIAVRMALKVCWAIICTSLITIWGAGFGTQQYAGPSGPPTGAVAYPYYTNRGPRDFLANNPPSIGP